MLPRVYTQCIYNETFNMQLQLLPQLFLQVLTIFKLGLSGELAR